MTVKHKIFIIDIDDTICWCAKPSDYQNAQPFTERINKINKLYDEGHTIIYWTARGQCSGIDHTHLTIHQLEDWGCKYHKLKMDKPHYDVWVDDKSQWIF